MKPPPIHTIVGRVLRIGLGGDGTTWPWPFNKQGDDQDSPAWKARYAPQALTRSDLLELDEIAHAYSTLITHPVRSVAERIHELRAVYRWRSRQP